VIQIEERDEEKDSRAIVGDINASAGGLKQQLRERHVPSIGRTEVKKPIRYLTTNFKRYNYRVPDFA
jgi:hypothetical protein